MNLFALSDLHLPGSDGKLMDKFGENWIDHSSKMKINWNNKIKKDDIVLVPGDLSWAMTWEGAKDDIEFLTQLNGTKYIVKGNHDYFLSSNHKCKDWFKDLDTENSKIRFLYNSSTTIKHPSMGNIGIFGTRGWSFVAGNDLEHSQKICNRELNRLKISFDTLNNSECDILIAMFHYPPTNKFFSEFDEMTENSIHNSEEGNELFGFEIDDQSELIYQENYDDRLFEFVRSVGVDIVVFGHIHQMDVNYHKIIDETHVYCCSADIINFDPIEIPIKQL